MDSVTVSTIRHDSDSVQTTMCCTYNSIAPTCFCASVSHKQRPNASHFGRKSQLHIRSQTLATKDPNPNLNTFSKKCGLNEYWMCLVDKNENELQIFSPFGRQSVCVRRSDVAVVCHSAAFQFVFHFHMFWDACATQSLDAWWFKITFWWLTRWLFILESFSWNFGYIQCS